MLRLVLIWLCLAAPLAAAPITVTSGEHDGFTRLVFDFGTPVDWQVGRTLDGYALQLRGVPEGQAQPYDLAKVFDLIGKGRLAAIWADPNTAQLNIGIACACHAIPFEFRPGILVIDLRDGAAPKGSSFELSMDGGSVPTLDAKPAPRPRLRPQGIGATYNWTARALADLRASPIIPRVQTTGFGDPTLQILRDSLLFNLSRGAARGVVDLALPPSALNPKNGASNPPKARFSLGDLPGVAVSAGLPDHADVAAKGQICPGADQLALSTWGTADPVSAQMANAASGLVAEFDQPDPAAIGAAVRFQLFLGFGVESRQLMQAFDSDLPDKVALLSLGYIMDQIADPQPAFVDHAACDTPAALWAVMSDPAPAVGDTVNTDAVLRAFSELPVHLRRHLGPDLAQRFLALGDDKTAMTVRNAITRAPGDPGPQVALVDAAIAMAQGDPATAETRLEAVLADAGPQSAAALIALTDARIAQNLPVDAELVTALESLLVENTDTDQQPAIRRALVLARAASGDFDMAFAGLPNSPNAAGDLWRILSAIGTDQAILAHAVLPLNQETPMAEPQTATTLATRLLGFGLADQALGWALSLDVPNPLLLAQIHLARRDGQAALVALADMPDEAASTMRALAQEIVGASAAAAQSYTALGDIESARHIAINSRDWQQIAALSPDDWGAVVKNLGPADAKGIAQPQAASLAGGRKIAESAAQTRADIDALLSNIATP